MSEDYTVINLVLGLIGTITGIIAIFISYWTLRKEHPHLEMKTLSCSHRVEGKRISIAATFQIKNLGDRGTSVNDMDVTFRHSGKQYTLKREFFTERYGGFMDSFQKKWVNAHETVDFDTSFWGDIETIDSECNDREKIECTFILYHTHGAEKIKHISQERRGSS